MSVQVSQRMTRTLLSEDWGVGEVLLFSFQDFQDLPRLLDGLLWNVGQSFLRLFLFHLPAPSSPSYRFHEVVVLCNPHGLVVYLEGEFALRYSISALRNLKAYFTTLLFFEGLNDGKQPFDERNFFCESAT